MKIFNYKFFIITIALLGLSAPSFAQGNVSNREAYRNTASKATTGNRIFGEWIVLSAKGKDTNIRDAAPFLNFNASDNKIYGEVGGNIINATFSVKTKGVITVSNVESTRQPSDNVREENDIKAGLSEAATYTIEKKKNDIYFLDILDKKGNVVIHAKRHNADIMTGLWTIAEIYQTDVRADSLEIVVDVPELKIHGKTGCNIFNGDIGLDRNKDWFIQFQNIIVSRMKCDESKMAVERNLLVALEDVEIIKRENGGKTMRLLDKNKKEVLLLNRIMQ